MRTMYFHCTQFVRSDSWRWQPPAEPAVNSSSIYAYTHGEAESAQWSMLCCCHGTRLSSSTGLPFNLPGKQQGMHTLCRTRVCGMASSADTAHHSATQTWAPLLEHKGPKPQHTTHTSDLRTTEDVFPWTIAWAMRTPQCAGRSPLQSKAAVSSCCSTRSAYTSQYLQRHRCITVQYSTVVGWEGPSLSQGSLELMDTICYSYCTSVTEDEEPGASALGAALNARPTQLLG
jgi:hypothetical protein